MNKSLNQCREFFDRYVENFDMTIAPLQRKKDHTRRVAEQCRRTAIELDLSQQDIELAEAIGWFHDLGRFEQWMRLESFSDFETIDHAALGMRILEDAGWLEDEPERRVIDVAIRNHNQFKIAEDVSNERELLFCKLIRDADKIDILNEYLIGEFHLPEHAIYSQAALEEVAKGKLIDRSVFDGDDRRLDALAFFNDFYFDCSKRYLRKERFLEQILELYIKSAPEQGDELRNVAQAINKHI